MLQPVLISWLLAAAHVLIVLVAAVLISANRKPSAAIAWLLAIIFVPLLGVCAFLLVGFGRLPRKRRSSSVRFATRSWLGPPAWTG
jgi:cardiolipin synthase